MTAIRGYPSQQKLDRTQIQFVTVEPVHKEQNGASVVAHQYVLEVGTDAAEAGSTAGKIVATGHAAVEGDVILFTSGAHSGKEIKVVSVVSNDINLAEDLASAIAVGTTFTILRHKYPLVDAMGNVKVSGTFTSTEEAVAADGAALPAKVKVAGGYDGSAVQVLKTDANGELQIDVLSSALPTGAATDSTISAMSGKLPATLGQKTMAASMSVAIASDQGTLPVSGSVTVSGQSEGSTGVAVPSKAEYIAGTDGTLLRGIKTDTAGKLQVDVVTTALGNNASTEATLLAMSNKLPATIGPKLSQNSMSIVLASDHAAVPVSGSITTTNASEGSTGSAVPTKADFIAGTDGTNLRGIKTDAAGELQIDVLSSALPTGAATETTLAALNAKVTAVNTGAVTVSSSALPTGAATETTLSAVSGKLPATLGQKVMASSLSVTLASDQTALPISGSITSTSSSEGTPGSAPPTKASYIAGTDGTLVRALKTDTNGELQVDILSSALPTGAATETTLAGASAKLPATLGQKAMAASMAVTLASDQSAIPASQSGTWNINNVAGTVSLPTGASTAANQSTIITSLQLLDDVVATDGVAALTKGYQIAGTDGTNAQIVSTNVSGHVNIADGGNSITVDGTVAATQSGAWNITNVTGTVSLPTGAATETTLAALNTKTPAQGQALMAASVPVVIASNQSAVPVSASSLPLPTGAATETTLAAASAKLPATLGQKVMASSLAVTIASDQGAIPVTASFSPAYLSVVDLFDANILDTSSTNIPGSGGSPVQVVASTAAAVKALQCLDTTGAFIGVYTGAAAAEVLKFVIGPGSDQTIENAIPAGTRISLKRLDSTTAISSGIVAINFLG